MGMSRHFWVASVVPLAVALGCGHGAVKPPRSAE